MNNQARSANVAISAYMATQNVATERDALVFLLGDLIHWANAKGINWPAALGQGMWHYTCEVADAGGET